MLKKGVFLATSTALLVAVFALTLRILCSEENVTAGLLTLKVHYSGTFLAMADLEAFRSST